MILVIGLQNIKLIMKILVVIVNEIGGRAPNAPDMCPIELIFADIEVNVAK